MKRRVHIGVIGAGTCNEATYELAMALGREIASCGWILICGGLGGVMEASCRGCSERGGTAVGILPGLEKEAANPWVTIPIPTGLGEGRNVLVVRASDVLVAVSGGYGTLSEIALALKTGKPVIGIDTWKDIEGIKYVQSPSEAIETARTLVG